MWVQSLALELPHDMGSAKKKKKQGRTHSRVGDSGGWRAAWDPQGPGAWEVDLRLEPQLEGSVVLFRPCQLYGEGP